MNWQVLALLALRSAALGLQVSGQGKTAATLYSLANLVESGRATEEHMALVAEKLKTGAITDADWKDVHERILSDSERLHAG